MGWKGWGVVAGIMVGLGVMQGCGSPELAASKPFPVLDPSKKVLVVELANYTDTPQAGKRAANIVEGVLSAKGVTSRLVTKGVSKTRTQQCALARRQGADYLLTGGVSEWRYKTGIDGEPAVSLTLQLLDSRQCRTVWSATGSDDDWGNASIGTTAQRLVEAMID